MASALLAYAQTHKTSGKDFLLAFIVGIESECRIGNAVFPDHYDRGWHITGTTGVFGAAIAIAKLMHASHEQITHAIGIAASQPVGLRDQFGTMTKSFHPGRAAQNGLLAAMLASKGYTSSNQALEAPRGWAHVLSDKQSWTEITDGLGTRWETSLNSFKPFACGIVLHPLIDACIQLRKENTLDATKLAEIKSIECSVHPLVLELTGKLTPQNGLEGKFSYTHAAAAALVNGKAGEAEFDDTFVVSSSITSIRSRVHATVDKSLSSDAAKVRITMQNGDTFDKVVEHALGSADVPLTDAQLAAKFMDLVEPILGRNAAEQVLASCWHLEDLKDVSCIATQSIPTQNHDDRHF